jgi:Zn-dependent protease
MRHLRSLHLELDDGSTAQLPLRAEPPLPERDVNRASAEGVLPILGLPAFPARRDGHDLPMNTEQPYRQTASPGPQARRGPWRAIAVTSGVVLLKAKALLGALKLASLGKLALTALSMLAMVWVEAARNGLWFGIGFVLLILIHELGHGWEIKRAGLEAGWPVFIPFVGAMIALRGRPQSRDVEARIAFAGPVAGTAASLVLAAFGLLLQSRLCFALAYTGFFLNLFNLVPMPPLDGGRVAAVFSPRGWILGAVILGAMFLATGAPQLLLIGLLALTRRGRVASDASFESTPDSVRKAWTTRYFGLCFFLGAAIFFTQRLAATG